MAKSACVAALIIGSWLVIGAVGYHYLAPMHWLDAFLNASMILSGMGPVDTLTNSAAKLFASAYAILSGVVFLSTTAVLLAPLVHRFLHQFHLPSDRA
jgi:hypothetical protein